jgi:hemolysin D
VTLDYEQVRAPVDGVVFDLKPSAAGYVATLGQPLLKLVPEDNLIAKVYITNRDIGFVREGMQADVRIDSFPYSEFGDIKGTLTRIGSDALPPDQIRQYYTFPAKIRLDRQTLLISGKQVQLQSGMSVNVNIKLRKRSVMSIFTDLFSQSVESMKFVR